MSIERMDEFFAARLSGYDEHMLGKVEGCKEAYGMIAELLPEGTKKLLDLGCGTGLELAGIFKKHPRINVTGIDISQAMLGRLREKYPGRNITLINADYLAYDLGAAVYDAAISFQTMHHFSHEEKLGLYKKIYLSLKASGPYIECDFMAADEAEERLYLREAEKLREENGVSGGLFHIDIPFTAGHQLALLKEEGFSRAETVFRKGSTTMISVRK